MCTSSKSNGMCCSADELGLGGDTDGIMILNAQQQTVVINQTLASMLGIASEDAIGFPYHEVLSLDNVTVCKSSTEAFVQVGHGFRLLRYGGGAEPHINNRLPRQAGHACPVGARPPGCQGA